MKDAVRICPKARLAVGHSEAEPQQIEALMPYGLCLGTHHTNATGTLSKYPECRDETVNYNREIYAELIRGSRADLVLVDHAMDVKQVFLEGNAV